MLRCSQGPRYNDAFLSGSCPKRPEMTTTNHPSPVVAAELPAVPLTTEGYSVLHQMLRLRWTDWRALPAAEKSAIAREATDVLSAMEKHSPGQSALFSLIG